MDKISIEDSVVKQRGQLPQSIVDRLVMSQNVINRLTTDQKLFIEGALVCLGVPVDDPRYVVTVQPDGSFSVMEKVLETEY